MTADQLFARMHKEYQRFWNDERTAKAQKLGLTPTEVATIASIIASETNKSFEYPTIASIYINRLRKGIALQACPTVIFAVGDFSLRRVLKRHLAIDSPYNTYKYYGLPLGPISCPGEESLKAAVDPENHDYIYYVLKERGSSEHVYCKTYDEFLNAKAKYQKSFN